MDPISQSSVTKLSASGATSQNEIAIRTLEQMFGQEFEISNEMSVALRALQRICQASGLDLIEQIQFAFERQEICLTKLAKQKKSRKEKTGVPGFSERSWLRSAMRASREERSQRT